MKIDLAGRRAIVTASASGIGFSIARGLAGAGALVIVNGRRDETTSAAVDRLRDLVPGASVEGIAGDLSTAAGVAAFIEQAGEADIVINNLGIYEQKAFVDISDEDWTRFFETNLFSGIRLSRHYLPRMLEQNWGRLVFITSESGVTPPPSRLHYATSKSAQITLARGLAEITAGTCVTSNSIIVGVTKTEAVHDLIVQMAIDQGISEIEVERNLVAHHRPTQLLKRLATSDEVANMVVYIASTQAAATNGAALRVDGGGLSSIL